MQAGLWAELWNADAENLYEDGFITSFYTGVYTTQGFDGTIKGTDELLLLVGTKEGTSYSSVRVLDAHLDESGNILKAQTRGYTPSLSSGTPLLTSVPASPEGQLLLLLEGWNAKNEREDLAFLLEPVEGGGRYGFTPIALAELPEGYSTYAEIGLYANSTMQITSRDTMQAFPYQIELGMHHNIFVSDGAQTREISIDEHLFTGEEERMENLFISSWNTTFACVSDETLYIAAELNLMDSGGSPLRIDYTLVLLAVHLPSATLTVAAELDGMSLHDVVLYEEDFILSYFGGGTTYMAADGKYDSGQLPENRLTISAINLNDFSVNAQCEADLIGMELYPDYLLRMDMVSPTEATMQTRDLYDGSRAELSANISGGSIERSPAATSLDRSDAHHPDYMIGYWYEPLSQVGHTAGYNWLFTADGTFTYQCSNFAQDERLTRMGGTWYMIGQTLYLEIQFTATREGGTIVEPDTEHGESHLVDYIPTLTILQENDVQSMPFSTLLGGTSGLVMEFYNGVRYQPIYDEEEWVYGHLTAWMEEMQAMEPGVYEYIDDEYVCVGS